MTTTYQPRFSTVSSLAASFENYLIAAGAASRLQVVSQQHYATAQSSFLIPEEPHRLERPLSRTLPKVHTSGSELSLTPSLVASIEQSRNGEKAHEDETTHDVCESKHVVPGEAHEFGSLSERQPVERPDPRRYYL